MQVFLIKQHFKNNIFKSVLKKIEAKDDEIYLNFSLDKLNINKKIKIIRNVVKILRQKNSNKVILSKKVKEDKQFIDLLYSNQIDIIQGRYLFKMLITEVLENVIIKNKIKKEESEIAITVNNRGKWELGLIKKIAQDFKSVKIVTNNIDYFKNLEDNLFEEEGIIITTTNNKRKALRTANIILNVDFPEELINKYNVHDNSIIINVEEKVKINKKRFCGKIINDFNIKLKKDTNISFDLEQKKYEDFDLKDLVECYVTNSPKELENIIVC